MLKMLINFQFALAQKHVLKVFTKFAKLVVKDKFYKISGEKELKLNLKCQNYSLTINCAQSQTISWELPKIPIKVH